MIKNIRFFSHLKIIFIIAILTINNIANANTLRLVTIFYPPYIYEENGVVKGFSVDVVKKVFQKMGQKITIEVLPWARSQQDLKDGRADVIFTVFKTKEREEFMDFNQFPVVDQNISFYIRKGDNIKFDDDFKNIIPNTVGTVRAVNYGLRFAKAKEDNIFSTEESDDYEKCVQKLVGNRTNVIIGNELVVGYILNKLLIEKGKIQKLSPRVETVPSYIAFSKKKDYSALKNKFDENLQKIKENGEYSAIQKKWGVQLK